jgi:hypothetical protein
MRVLAAFNPALAGDEENAPCQRKNPITRSGRVQSNITLQESFIPMASVPFTSTIEFAQGTIYI